MVRHSVDNENSEKILGEVPSETFEKKCNMCCYFAYLMGYSVPLVLGFYIGYKYELDNCSCGSF